MNNIDQMIEVLNAYKRGEKIEFKNGSFHDWTPCDPTGPTWDFYRSEYRIAKPEPKKIKLQAWLMPSGMLVWRDMSKVETWHTDAIRIPEEDKEITLP